MATRFVGRTVVVTGANSGLGEEVTHLENAGDAGIAGGGDQ